jgi:hypothetical protein
MNLKYITTGSALNESLKNFTTPAQKKRGSQMFDEKMAVNFIRILVENLPRIVQFISPRAIQLVSV